VDVPNRTVGVQRHGDRHGDLDDSRKQEDETMTDSMLRGPMVPIDTDEFEINSTRFTSEILVPEGVGWILHELVAVPGSSHVQGMLSEHIKPSIVAIWRRRKTTNPDQPDGKGDNPMNLIDIHTKAEAVAFVAAVMQHNVALLSPNFQLAMEASRAFEVSAQDVLEFRREKARRA
jgi:hypothetical protein